MTVSATDDFLAAPGAVPAGRWGGSRCCRSCRRCGGRPACRPAPAGLLSVFAELPRLVGKALGVSWRVDRIRTSVAAAAAARSGVIAAFGLLATRRVRAEFFAAGPTPHRVAAALPALGVLAVATGIEPARASRPGTRRTDSHLG